MDPGTPVIPARSGVGVDLEELERGVLHPVEAAGVVPGGEGGAGLEGAVGAAGVPRLQLARDDTAVALHAAPDGQDRGLVGVAGGQLFRVGHHDLHRPARFPGEEERDGQVPGVPLAAELAAHVHGVHADPVRLHADGAGQHPARPEGVLGARPDLQAAVRVDGQQSGVGLQVALVPAGDAESVLQGDVRLAETLLHVALAPEQPGKAVVDVGSQALVGRPVVARDIVVDQRRSGLGGRQRIEHRGQNLVVHLDEAKRRFRGLGGLRRHRGHPVADVPHPVPAQHRHVEDLLAHEMVGDVLARHHGLDPGSAPGAVGVDAADAGVGMGAPEDLAPEQPFARDVGGIPGAPGDLVRPLGPRHGSADDFEIRHGSVPVSASNTAPSRSRKGYFAPGIRLSRETGCVSKDSDPLCRRVKDGALRLRYAKPLRSGRTGLIQLP